MSTSNYPSKIDDQGVIESSGYTLPVEYAYIFEIFNHIEQIVQHGVNTTKARIWFEDVCKEVRESTKGSINGPVIITKDHLRQIIAIYPNSYELKCSPKTQSGKDIRAWDLVMTPKDDDLYPFVKPPIAKIDGIDGTQNLIASPANKQFTSPANKQISPNKCDGLDDFGRRLFVKTSPRPYKRTLMVESEHPDSQFDHSPSKKPQQLGPTMQHVQNALISPSKASAQHINTTAETLPLIRPHKMSSERIKSRRMIMRHLLVKKLKFPHEEYLKENKLKTPADASFHPQFIASNTFPELELGDIPQSPSINSQPDMSDVGKFLKSVGAGAKRQIFKK